MQQALATLSNENNGRMHKLNVWDRETKPNFNFVDSITNIASKDISIKLMGKDFAPNFVKMVNDMAATFRSEKVFTEDEYHELFEAYLEDTKK